MGGAESTADSKKKPALTVDVEWYLSTQMLPPTERLCDPIEGTSRSILAQHFGLDAAKYAQASFSGMSVDEDLIGYTPSTQMPDAQRYKDCKKFIITCPDCKTSTSFNGIFNFVEDPTTTLPEAKSGLLCTFVQLFFGFDFCCCFVVVCCCSLLLLGLLGC